MIITKRDITDFEHKDLYLRRWSLWLPFGWSIKLHKIVKPDGDRCLHCHPWAFLRIILYGGYIEKTDKKIQKILPWRPWTFWRIYPCRANFKHRIIKLLSKENWSLIICAPKIREWGFFTNKGWRPWTEFLNSGKVNWCDGETNMPTVYGWGTNDADYRVTKKIDGKQVWICPYYSVWRNMIKRCYSQSDMTYENCSIDHKWSSFMKFRKWMKSQDWEDKQIDKDLLGSGKIYSPSTCCFLSHKINSLLSEKKDNNNLPSGIYKRSDTGRLAAQCANINGETISLGSFDNVQKAEIVRNRFKSEVLIKHAQSLSLKLKKALINKAKRL